MEAGAEPVNTAQSWSDPTGWGFERETWSYGGGKNWHVCPRAMRHEIAHRMMHRKCQWMQAEEEHSGDGQRRPEFPSLV